MNDPDPARAAAARPNLAQKFGTLIRRVPKRATVLVALAVLLAYSAYLSVHVVTAFEGRRWDIPAHVYAAPMELYAGKRITAGEVADELRRTGYLQTEAVSAEGQFSREADQLRIWTRPFRHWDALDPPGQFVLTLTDGRVVGIHDASNRNLSLVRLEPVRLGSLFASHHEDRLLVAPEDIPPLLVDALKAVEDRRFDRHIGIDFAAILRAALVNLRHGEIRQGGSTLTQQLVKSYFLDGRRTFGRKFREAIMAIALEIRYDKDELLHAYVNEIYMGQQGARAIHGFGLASEFYFARPLSRLEVHEIALLVALVRGPSYYDPRKHPERALARRNTVLDAFAEQGVIDEDSARQAAARELGVDVGRQRLSRYQPAYMDLVRRQLADDYPLDELTTQGLRIFTNLDPQVQAAAERELSVGLASLERPDSESSRELEGAAVVTNPQTGEVLAMVGGRNVEFDGFNRALEAQRPIGSLIKPVVYLAAIQSGRYTMASPIADDPVEIDLPNGKTWTPENFDKTSHGEVPLLRALAESFNQATVRLGMETGPEVVAALLRDLGLADEPAAHPSLLLGATDLSPFDVAMIYGTLANGGFRTPLRAVRSVIDAEGSPLVRYPLELEPAADIDAVQQVNSALVQVVERGTARYAGAMLPEGLTVAGKTGTSNDLRDSWFAGFASDRLAVVWVGRDDNQPAGLTGASGALRIWTNLFSSLRPVTPFNPVQSANLQAAWIDFPTGLSAYEDCGDSVQLLLPIGREPRRLAGCGRGLRDLGRRAKRWLGGLGDGEEQP